MTHAPPPRPHRLLPVVLACLSMIGPFTIDTIFPAFTTIERDYGVTATASQQLISAYLIAFAVMSIFHGPISDSVGRKPVIVTSLVVYAAASILGALAPSFAWLIVARVVQGGAAGGAMVISRAVVRDIYSGPQAQRVMSVIVMIFGLAPAIAPIMGGVIVAGLGWHALFWFLTVYAGLAIVMVWRALPESLAPHARQPLRITGILTGVWQVARVPVFHRIAWAGGFAFGGFFLYISSAALIVEGLLGGGPTDYWWLFGPLIAGMMIGSAISGRTADTMDPARLVALALGAGVVVTAVGWALAVFAPGLPGYAMIAAPALLGTCIGASYPNIQLAVLDEFDNARGAASSASTFVGLLVNAAGAGLLAAAVGGSFAALAAASCVHVSIAAGLWALHLRSLRTAVSAA